MKKIFLSILAGMALAACAMQNSDKVVGSYYDSDAARYRQNVVVKEQNDAFVTY